MNTASAPQPETRRYAWHAWVLLYDPARVDDQLTRLLHAGRTDARPTLWQLELGVLRMWHRVLFRSETVGTSAQPQRTTARARVLANRAARVPALLRERAIAPLDHTGLAQPAWRMIRHLLAAHHDGAQSVYDLEILAQEPGALDEVIHEARAVVDGTHPRAAWLRDLVVYEGYHERLLAHALAVRAGALPMSPADLDNPDISLRAFLRWCAAQPATPEATLAALRAGAFPARPAT